MISRMKRSALAVVLLSITPLWSNAQELVDPTLYEDAIGDFQEAAARSARLADYLEDEQSLNELVAGAGLYLSMDEIVSFEVIDGAGNPDQVTLLGDASEARLEPGARLKALTFSTSDYATVQNSPDIDVGTEDFSIFTWVRTDATGTHTFLDKRQSSGVSGYSLNTYGGKVLLQLATSNGWDNYFNSNSTSVDDGLWHHIGATVDRDSATGGKLYVDGQVVHTFNPARQIASLSNSSDLYIGRHPFSSGSFSGALDEIVIAKRVLSAGEISTLMSTEGAAVRRLGAYGSELHIRSTTSSHIEIDYRLPNPATTGLVNFNLCISSYSAYSSDPCSDPMAEVHELSYNSNNLYGRETYSPYDPDKTYYLGLTGKQSGVTSYEILVVETATTKPSQYTNHVWHTDVTETSMTVNWTTSISPIVAVEVCWKKAGSFQGICDPSDREHSKFSFTSQPTGSFVISDLTPGEEYKYKVRIYDYYDQYSHKRDNIGTGTAYTKSIPRIDVWIQDITKNTMTVWWTANSTYPEYEVCWKKTGSLRDTCHDPRPVYSPTTNFQITGLRNNNKYRIKVYGILGSNRVLLSDETRKTAR